MSEIVTRYASRFCQSRFDYPPSQGGDLPHTLERVGSPDRTRRTDRPLATKLPRSLIKRLTSLRSPGRHQRRISLVPRSLAN